MRTTDLHDRDERAVLPAKLDGLAAIDWVRAAIDGGARTVEVLKQGQYMPMTVEQQVMTIFAVTNGFIDDVPVNKVREWEKGLQEFMKAKYPNVVDGIRTKKELSKDLEADLRRGIEAYKQSIAK